MFRFRLILIISLISISIARTFPGSCPSYIGLPKLNRTSDPFDKKTFWTLIYHFPSDVDLLPFAINPFQIARIIGISCLKFSIFITTDTEINENSLSVTKECKSEIGFIDSDFFLSNTSHHKLAEYERFLPDCDEWQSNVTILETDFENYYIFYSCLDEPEYNTHKISAWIFLRLDESSNVSYWDLNKKLNKLLKGNDTIHWFIPTNTTTEICDCDEYSRIMTEKSCISQQTHHHQFNVWYIAIIIVVSIQLFIVYCFFWLHFK